MNTRILKIFFLAISIMFGTLMGIAQQSKIDSLTAILPHLKLYNDKIEVLNKLSLRLQRSNPDSALSTSEMALKLSQLNKDEKRIAEALKNLGNIYYEKNATDKAQKYYNESIEIFETLKDTLGLAKIHNNLGALYRTQGLYKKALDSYQKSLDLRHAINDSAGMGKTYNNIGNMHYSLGNLETALTYYKQSLTIRKKYNDQLGVGSCYTNIGLIFVEKEYYDSAITNLNKAMQIHTKFGDTMGVANCQSTIGYTYLKTAQTTKAIEVLNQALEKYKRLSNIKGVAKTLNLLIETYNSIGQYATAINYANQTLKLDSGKIPNVEKMQTHKQLTMALEGTRNYKLALENYKQHVAYKENLLSIEKLNEIEKIERLYQSETQKLKIKNLQNDNRIKHILLEKLRIRQTFIYIAFTIALGFILFLLITRKKLKKRNETIRKQNAIITTHKTQLEEHQNHLEKLIQKRTADLVKAKEHAEESDRLKSAFLANMSHEIRTPMNAIMGFTELLNMTDHDEETKKVYLQLIQQNSTILLQLMDDIIDIAKIEVGQISVRKIKTNVANIVAQVEKVLIQKRNTAGKHHINIATIIEKSAKGIEIFTDPIRLQQILTNLTDNALKFTDAGHINIKLSIDHSEEIDNLLITVEDTGIGMNKGQMSEIFNRFNKKEISSTKLYRGAGLGLAISKNLAELLGGSINVKSTPEKGTTFCLRIPLKSCKQ